jgi:hypothetical protein
MSMGMRWLRIGCASAAVLVTTACGVGEMGAAAAAGGASKAEEARQAEETKARVQQSLDAAAVEAARQRAAAEEASQ